MQDGVHPHGITDAENCGFLASRVADFFESFKNENGAWTPLLRGINTRMNEGPLH